MRSCGTYTSCVFSSRSKMHSNTHTHAHSLQITVISTVRVCACVWGYTFVDIPILAYARVYVCVYSGPSVRDRRANACPT